MGAALQLTLYVEFKSNSAVHWMWLKEIRGGATGEVGPELSTRKWTVYIPWGGGTASHTLFTLLIHCESRLQVAFGVSSVQQDVSCLLLMHCCKVFDVHYRFKEREKERSALCILHQCHSVSSSMVLNIASISKLWNMYEFPGGRVFFSFLFPSAF